MSQDDHMPIEVAETIGRRVQRSLLAHFGRVTGYVLLLVPPSGTGELTITTNLEEPDKLMEEARSKLAALPPIGKATH